MCNQWIKILKYIFSHAMYAPALMSILIGAPQSVQAGEIDFRKGYGNVRQQLLRQGWKPAAFLDPNAKSSCKYAPEWWCRLPDFANCSGTGNGACDTLWIAPDLRVYRKGNDANGNGGNLNQTITYSPDAATWLCHNMRHPRLICPNGIPQFMQ